MVIDRRSNNWSHACCAGWGCVRCSPRCRRSPNSVFLGSFHTSFQTAKSLFNLQLRPGESTSSLWAGPVKHEYLRAEHFNDVCLQPLHLLRLTDSFAGIGHIWNRTMICQRSYTRLMNEGQCVHIFVHIFACWIHNFNNLLSVRVRISWVW